MGQQKGCQTAFRVDPRLFQPDGIGTMMMAATRRFCRRLLVRRTFVIAIDAHVSRNRSGRLGRGGGSGGHDDAAAEKQQHRKYQTEQSRKHEGQ